MCLCGVVSPVARSFVACGPAWIHVRCPSKPLLFSQVEASPVAFSRLACVAVKVELAGRVEGASTPLRLN